MVRRSLHPFVLTLGAAICVFTLSPGWAQAPAATKAVCFATSETRDEIKAHHLLEPFIALKGAANPPKTEALSAKLCRVGEEFVYEIAVLHRDGRLVHIVMSAATGKLVNSRIAHEAAPRN